MIEINGDVNLPDVYICSECMENIREDGKRSLLLCTECFDRFYSELVQVADERDAQASD